MGRGGGVKEKAVFLDYMTRCSWCGKWMYITSKCPTKKFCCHICGSCNDTEQKRLKRGLPPRGFPVKFICAYCGKSGLKHWRATSQKYHVPDCAKEVRKKRDRLRRREYRQKGYWKKYNNYETISDDGKPTGRMCVRCGKPILIYYNIDGCRIENWRFCQSCRCRNDRIVRICGDVI